MKAALNSAKSQELGLQSPAIEIKEILLLFTEMP